MAWFSCSRGGSWWKWFIAVTVSLQYFLVYGCLYNYSILFVSLQAEFESSAVLAGWPGSLSNAVTNIFSPITALLLLRLRPRTVVIIGHVFICTGTMLTSLVPALAYAVLTYGVIVGVGTNLVVHTVTGLCLEWFKSGNFGRANGIVVLGSSVGLLAFSPLLTSWIGRFGWRLTLRYISVGIFVLGVGCSLPFYLKDPPVGENMAEEEKDNPTEWIDLKEIEPLDPELSSSSQKSCVTEDMHTGDVQSEDMQGKDFRSVDLRGPNARKEDLLSKEMQGQVLGVEDSQPEDTRSKDLLNKDQQSEDLGGTMGPQKDHNKDPAVISQKDAIEKTSFSCRGWDTCRLLMGVDQWVWTIGLCLALMGWTFFIINFASFIEGRGLSRERVPFVIMFLAIGEICGKILVCIVGDHIPCQRIYLLSASMLLGTVALSFMTAIRTFSQMMALSISLIRSILYAISNTTAADLFLKTHGSNGVMVLAMVPYGIGTLLGAPVSGGLYDITGDYVLSLIVIAVIFLCASAAFLSIAVRRRMKSRGRCCYATDQARAVPL